MRKRSELEELSGGTDDTLDRGHVAILDLPVRIRDVEARHSQDRTVEVEDRLLGEDGGDLGPEAGGTRRLLHDDDAAGLRSGREQRLLVERPERPEIEHLDRGLAAERV